MNQALVKKVLADPACHRVVRVSEAAEAAAARIAVPALGLEGQQGKGRDAAKEMATVHESVRWRHRGPGLYQTGSGVTPTDASPRIHNASSGTTRKGNRSLSVVITSDGSYNFV